MTNSRFSRQSFLGPDSETIFRATRVGIAGLGGGGSHVVLQLAHLGFRSFVLYDADEIEDSNLNRLVGGTILDVAMGIPKVLVAERVIRSIAVDAQVERYQKRWQDQPASLRSCDLIFGCVDGYRQRWELQVFSRRFCIPYIDVGLDVNAVGSEGPKMRGQAILTVPGGPCMKCIDFLNDENLEKEGTQYGDAGIRPQVVWANGVLAATAVGLAVDLLTGWTRSIPEQAVVYLTYDGNTGSVTPDKRLRYVPKQCPHFADGDVGEPNWQPL
jgi:molybdopterin/thiamine biosynthesis adenylyltransferase